MPRTSNASRGQYFRNQRGDFNIGTLNADQLDRVVNTRITNSLARFQKELQAFTNDLVPEKLTQLQRKIAMMALNRIVKKTPVDTGRARGNWQTTIDRPATGENAKAKWTTVISDANTTLQRIQPFGAVFIVNNLPYIVRLENGWSKQAPRGMITITIEEMRAMFG